MTESPRWESYNAYLASSEWAHIRTMVLERAHFRCQVCNSSVKLHVHHRVYDCRWGQESTDDLIALCQSCHGLFHRKEPEIKKAQRELKKEENRAKEAARHGTGKKKKKKKKKGQESPYAKTARLSGPVKKFDNVDIKAYEQESLAKMEDLKRKRTANETRGELPRKQSIKMLCL